MRKFLPLVLPVLLAACTSTPVIQTGKFARPQTVAIVEPPPMRNAAVIGVIGYDPGFHFSPMADYFFVIDPARGAAGGALPPIDGGMIAASATTGAILAKDAPGSVRSTGAQIGTAFAVGAMIDAYAAGTQRKAEKFHEEVVQQMPALDLRAEFSQALREALAAKGIRTVQVTDSVNAPVRLRWPTGAADGVAKTLPVSTLDAPAVDADLLVQYSPVAFYMAPGPLNNYRVRAVVGVAVFNGRTKQFLGHQNFSFNPNAWQNEYTTYTQLAENIDKVVPAVRAGLLSMVPEIAAVVGKQEKVD